MLKNHTQVRVGSGTRERLEQLLSQITPYASAASPSDSEEPASSASNSSSRPSVIVSRTADTLYAPDVGVPDVPEHAQARHEREGQGPEAVRLEDDGYARRVARDRQDERREDAAAQRIQKGKLDAW